MFETFWIITICPEPPPGQDSDMHHVQIEDMQIRTVRGTDHYFCDATFKQFLLFTQKLSKNVNQVNLVIARKQFI